MNTLVITLSILLFVYLVGFFYRGGEIRRLRRKISLIISDDISMLMGKMHEPKVLSVSGKRMPGCSQPGFISSCRPVEIDSSRGVINRFPILCLGKLPPGAPALPDGAMYPPGTQFEPTRSQVVIEFRDSESVELMIKCLEQLRPHFAAKVQEPSIVPPENPAPVAP